MSNEPRPGKRLGKDLGWVDLGVTFLEDDHTIHDRLAHHGIASAQPFGLTGHLRDHSLLWGEYY